MTDFNDIFPKYLPHIYFEKQYYAMVASSH